MRSNGELKVWGASAIGSLSATLGEASHRSARMDTKYFIKDNKMKDRTLFFVSIIFIIPPLYLFIISWFIPDRYFALLNKQKSFAKRVCHFMPEEFFDLIYYYDNKRLNLWNGRLISLVGILILILGMISAFL